MSVDPPDEFSDGPHSLEPEGSLGDAHHLDFPFLYPFLYQDWASHDARWTAPDDFSEGEEESDDADDVQGIEDSDDGEGEFGNIDWARFKVGKNRELSSWDQLGAGYNTKFASISRHILTLCYDGFNILMALLCMISQYAECLPIRSRCKLQIEIGPRPILHSLRIRLFHHWIRCVLRLHSFLVLSQSYMTAVQTLVSVILVQGLLCNHVLTARRPGFMQMEGLENDSRTSPLHPNSVCLLQIPAFLNSGSTD